MIAENLLKLAAHLDQLPADDSFDMRWFRADARCYESEVPTQHTCGTAACAIGHAPNISGFEPREGETWHAYTVRLFGLDTLEIADGQFDWMFGSQWSDVDNTPQGAAKRIRYFLAKGVPDGFVADYIDDKIVELYADA
jgi:hypothetical protein